MKSAWKSDIGKVRRRNEDFILADDERGIFLLADGMGGHPGGDVASALAVGSAHEFLVARGGETGDDGVSFLLAEALAAAHSAVARRGIEEPDLEGLGTTLDIVYLGRGSAWLCHVGDSRVYIFRRGELLQVTEDDNLASLLARQGVPPAEIPPHARHVLTQAVGVSDELLPEIRRLEVEEDSILLMCSDGLTGMVPDDIIAQIVRDRRNGLQGIANRIVAEAISRGGYDNVSVILIDPEFRRPPGESLLLPGRRNN
ncbi:protein phosphatase 2C domain-containing protein [Geobacter sp.]|uniref:PP2C family protein-serine/threonine phosphatase n=2 Tax=Geobacter sp. TaxID=46610 RepID=UPI00260FBF92|nr:protein phosphatase 2C domain-containing protein [Geobacter sp.]